MINPLELKMISVNLGLHRILPFRLRMESEGLAEFMEIFQDTDVFDKILLTDIKTFESLNPDLDELCESGEKVTIYDALEFLGLIDHVIKFYRSLTLFSEKETIIAPVGLMYDDIKQDLSDFKTFAMAIFLHDMGKLISQSGHPMEGKKLLTDSPISGLIKEFCESEGLGLDLMKNLILYHSLLGDLVIIKEISPESFFSIIFDSQKDHEERQKLLGMLLLFIIADMDSHGNKELLSADRVKQLVSIFDAASGAIDEDASMIFMHDQIRIGWGLERFDCWVVRERDSEVVRDSDLRRAKIELRSYIERAFYQERSFYKVLGGLGKVTLVFDLIQAIDDAGLRARLLIWIEDLTYTYYGVKSIHFRLKRLEPDTFLKQIDKMNRLLASFDFDEMARELEYSYEKGTKELVISIPVK
ncbi:MAG: hypothetical protein HQ564_04440 [Candidatus Saganbacteria bacterium]|nr:hypothetical protein [Candidatus Saganbacteria bacterium]